LSIKEKVLNHIRTVPDKRRPCAKHPVKAKGKERDPKIKEHPGKGKLKNSRK